MIAKILSLQLLIVLSALVPNLLAPAAAQEEALTVRTNDDEYDLEETVRVTGKVGELVGSENVIVKWIKPDRNSITLPPVAPKLDGTYSATLLLDPETVTGGKWMVEVAYSDRIANSTFVVKDPFFDVDIVGSNVSVFENGQQVTIAGTIFNKEPSEERVIMTIRNAKGNIFESLLVLLDKKEFSHTFSLEGSKVLYGEWTVDLRYFGGHRTALTFDVVPSPVTIKTDKSSFFPGDVAVIRGELDESIASGNGGKVVSIIITNQNGDVYATKQVETSSNGSYVSQVELFGLKAASYGAWKAVAEYDDHRGIASFSMKEQTMPVTVKTNMPSFTSGQPIRVLGKVAELGSHSVAVHLFSDSGKLLKYAETNVNQNYTFAHEITPDHDSDPGIYEILVTYDGKEARTTFEVKNSVIIVDDDDGVPVITGTYKLEIDEHIHNIKYKLMGTEAIEHMTLNNQTKTLTMEVFSSQNGTLTLEIPRRVIDSVGQNGSDIQYLISATYANGSLSDLAYNEANSTDRLRILTMDFEKDTDLITITGTKVIPEFGALPAIALVAAIVLTMTIGYLGSLKYRTRNRI
ncbi:MAG TPA: hypothetical protein VIB07_07420 [Nitrososphaera sp.]